MKVTLVVDCTPAQVSARIEKMMGENALAQRVAVRTITGESVVGVYEGLSASEVLIEVDEASQMLVRIPFSEITMFGQYVPPLDRRNEISRG